MDENEVLNEPAVKKVFGITKVNVIKLRYEWKVFNFSVCGKNTGEELCSPIFSDQNNNLKWCLQLYAGGNSESSKDCVSIFLKYENTDIIKTLTTKFDFCIIDKHGKEMLKTKSTSYHFQKYQDGFGFPKFLERNDIINNDQYLPNDCLTIICNITAGTDITNLSHQNDLTHFEKPEHQILSGYVSLLNNEKLSDVLLIASGKEFHAHKAILAAQSPVFLAMFSTNMKEKEQNQIDFDMDYEVLQEILRFIYTGKIENIQTIINDLLAAADKYEIQGLKHKCEEYLSTNLNVDNVVVILSLADTYTADILRKHAIKFFISHKKELLTTDGFKFVGNLEPSTIEEIIRALIL